MSKKVTVVGAGGTGICTAADLTLSGHHVTLCDVAGRSDDRIEMVRARGGVNPVSYTHLWQRFCFYK